MRETFICVGKKCVLYVFPGYPWKNALLESIFKFCAFQIVYLQSPHFYEAISLFGTPDCHWHDLPLFSPLHMGSTF